MPDHKGLLTQNFQKSHFAYLVEGLFGQCDVGCMERVKWMNFLQQATILEEGLKDSNLEHDDKYT